MKEIGQESTTQVAVAPVPSRESPRTWDWRVWLVTIPLALLVTYAIIPILDNGFILLDDDWVIVENPHIRGLGLAQVKWAWTSLFCYYYPLAKMLYSAQYVIWKLDPRGYHLTSLLLQVVDAVVLYILTVALLVRCRTDSCLDSPWICPLSAGLATALFAVHPLRVEVAAWATCQPYLPCALFSMLAVLAYLRAFSVDSIPRWGWLAGSFLLFAASLLFYPVPVTLPVVLLILDVYPLRRFPDENGRWFGASARRALWEKVPFLMMSLLFMGLTIAARPQWSSRIEPYDASKGIAQACYATWFYIYKTVLPLGLTVVYPIPRALNWLAPPFALSILATLALSASSFLLRRRWPGLLAAWLSYLVILAPNSGIIRIYNFTVAADRFSYMPMLASVMLAAFGFCRLWRVSSRWHRYAPTGIMAIGLGALLGLSAIARNQCRTWRDTEAVFRQALNHGASSSPLVHRTLGVVLLFQGKYDMAEAHLTEAVRLDPSNAESHVNLATILWRRGKHEEAKAELAKALQLNPGNEEGHNNLGLFLAAQGKYDEAAAHFTDALRLNPGDGEAHDNLGAVLYAQGKYDEAEAHVGEALRLNPRNDRAHNNLGKILAHRGEQQAAEAHFAEAVRLNPDFAEAHNNLGLTLQTRGSYQAAEAQFTEALRADPGFVNAHYNLGVTRVARGMYEAAQAHFIEAIRLNPGFADAHYNLGVVSFNLGNYSAATTHFADAVRLRPGDPDACNASAMLMATCPEAKFRDGKRAVELATRGCELTQWKTPVILDTLAAAHAEAGDFDAALKSQKKAIELSTDTRQKEDYRSHLVLYQAKRPYRQVSPQHAPSGKRP